MYINNSLSFQLAWGIPWHRRRPTLRSGAEQLDVLRTVLYIYIRGGPPFSLSRTRRSVSPVSSGSSGVGDCNECCASLPALWLTSGFLTSSTALYPIPPSLPCVVISFLAAFPAYGGNAVLVLCACLEMLGSLRFLELSVFLSNTSHSFGLPLCRLGLKSLSSISVLVQG